MHSRQHGVPGFPGVEEITTTWRGSYGYLTAWLTETESSPLCRIHYLGDPIDWTFVRPLPQRAPKSTPTAGYSRCVHRHPTQALDTALGLYPTAWPIKTPQD